MAPDVDHLNLLLNLRRYSEVEAAARTALAAAPEWGLGHTYLALSLFHRQDSNQDEMLAAARNGVKFDLHSSLSHAVLGMIHEIRKEDDDAVRCFEHSLSLDPTDVFARVRFGWFLFSRNKIFKALQLTADGLEYDPDDYDLLVLLAQIELSRNELENAEQTIRDGLRLYPNEPDLHHLLGWWTQLKNQNIPYHDSLAYHEGARQCFAEAVRLDPTNDHFHYYLKAANERVEFLRDELPRLPQKPLSEPDNIESDTTDAAADTVPDDSDCESADNDDHSQYVPVDADFHKTEEYTPSGFQKFEAAIEKWYRRIIFGSLVIIGVILLLTLLNALLR